MAKTYVPLECLDPVSTALVAAKNANSQSVTYVPRQKDYKIVSTTNVKLFGNDGIMVSDIRQGTIANCWILASLAGIANSNPQFLANHILENSDGNGWKVILYDENFRPVEVEISSVELIYPGLSGKDLWVKLFEVAFEKQLKEWHLNDKTPVHLFQNNTDFFRPSVGLHMVTGMEPVEVDASSQTLKNIDWTRNIGIISTSSGFVTKKGIKIMGDHAYTIIGFDPKTKQVTVNNPWGTNFNKKGKELEGGTLTLTLDEFESHFGKITTVQSP